MYGVGYPDTAENRLFETHDEALKWLKRAGFKTPEMTWHCREVSEIRLPASVVDLVEARLAKLPDKALEVFTHAAVIGNEFSFDVLAAVTLPLWIAAVT